MWRRSPLSSPEGVRTALVTGATGQVGHHVIQRLRRDGWEVRALVRDAARAGALSRAGVALATGDTLEPTSLVRAARGCEVVFHAAAVITPRGEWEAFRRPNVEGTRNVIAAAESAGARLVHVSSVAVYGASERYADGRGATDEESPLAELPEAAWYARSKRESEALVMAAHAAGRVWATAVRPDVIYGTHDRQFVPRIARLLRRGIAPLVGGGRSRLAVVNAANVADGMVRAAVTDSAGGRAYNLANDFDVTVEEFFMLAGEGMGIRLRRLPIPYLVARAGLGIAGLVAPLLVGNRYRMALSASLDFITRDNPFSSERARRELGWDPPVRPAEGVVEAFRWWTRHH
jgi:nucleoside-diphosphate-sugar epimerase